MLLTPAEFEATKEKIRKLNERSAKKGWTGRVELTGTLTEQVTTSPSGLPVKLQFVDATITGEPPRYRTADGKDWTFLARVESDENSGLVIYTAPGVDEVNRDFRPGECDHCRISRYRTYTYLVSDGTRQLQVGSTCLKDFLGWDINPSWISEPSLSDYEPDGGYGHTDPIYATDTVLAAAWATIQQFGYVKADAYWDGTPTKYAVMAVLSPRSKADREIAEAVAPHIDDAYAMAAKIRDFILSDKFTGSGDYAENLRNIAAGDYVAFKRFGFLVSAPQAWAKAQERDLIRRTEKAELLNEWNGNVGDKLELTVTVKSVRHVDTRFGTTHLYTMVGDDKRIYKWWASNEAWEAPFSDEPVKIRGTVKDHDEWEGRKSTVLTRVRVID